MKEEGFTIPKVLLQQLNESSYGGFLLFSFDETGAPRSYAQFDNEMNMFALQKSAEYWLEGVHNINAENIRCQFRDSSSEDDSDGRESKDEWLDSDEDDENFSS